MLGAIAGDIIGSVFEHSRPPIKTTDFPLFSHKSDFTDDSVLTFAVANAILNRGDYGSFLQKYARKYPGRGYGGRFNQWIYTTPARPYMSYGNGSAMRVSPVGFAFDSIERVLEEAEKSALPTHNHPEGIKGAQATALAIFLARKQAGKKEIKSQIETRFGYDLSRALDEIRPEYKFDVTCQGSVPEAIIAFLESENFEDAIRKSISLGGDTDTQACITGGIAQAFYGAVPPKIEETVRGLLPSSLLDVLDDFSAYFMQ